MQWERSYEEQKNARKAKHLQQMFNFNRKEETKIAFYTRYDVFSLQESDKDQCDL